MTSSQFNDEIVELPVLGRCNQLTHVEIGIYRQR